MKAKDLVKLIPNKVRITRHVAYEVVWTTEFLNDHIQLGECRYESRQILIKHGQSPTEAYKTFIHEVLHAISFEVAGLVLTENQVSKLEHAVFRLLKLNNLLESSGKPRHG